MPLFLIVLLGLAGLAGLAAYAQSARASAFPFAISATFVFVGLIGFSVTQLEENGSAFAVLLVLAGLAGLIGATFGYLGRGRVSSLSLAAYGFLIGFALTVTAYLIFMSNFNIGFGG